MNLFVFQCCNQEVYSKYIVMLTGHWERSYMFSSVPTFDNVDNFDNAYSVGERSTQQFDISID